MIAVAKLPASFLSKRNCGTSQWHSLQNRVAEAELLPWHYPQSYGNRTSPWHYPQSGVGELQEDNLLKQCDCRSVTSRNTPSDWSCWSGTSTWHYLRVELRKRNFLLFMFHVCQAVLSIDCSLVVSCRESANLLALLYVMFSCVFVTFPCGVLGQVWYLIESIPDLCLLPYFHERRNFVKTFTSEWSFGSGTLPWHYTQSGAGEAELREGTPLNCVIAAAELRETFLSEWSCRSGTSPPSCFTFL